MSLISPPNQKVTVFFALLLGFVTECAVDPHSYYTAIPATHITTTAYEWNINYNELEFMRELGKGAYGISLISPKHID
jgi:hypothetical protein